MNKMQMSAKVFSDQRDGDCAQGWRRKISWHKDIANFRGVVRPLFRLGRVFFSLQLSLSFPKTFLYSKFGSSSSFAKGYPFLV